MSHRDSHAAIFNFCEAMTQATKRPCAGFPDATAKVAFANIVFHLVASLFQPIVEGLEFVALSQVGEIVLKVRIVRAYLK